MQNNYGKMILKLLNYLATIPGLRHRAGILQKYLRESLSRSRDVFA